MFHMTQTQRSVLGTIILALTMTFGSMSAHASLISYNVIATPTLGGDTTFDLTFFIDDSQIPATGDATVTFSSVDVTFTGSVFIGAQSFTYSNDQTGIQNFFGTIQLIPFSGQIFASGALGIIQGVQAGPGGAGFSIARMGFDPANSFGPLVAITFFGSALNKANTQTDRALIQINTLTGPTLVAPVSAIPLPASLPLFAIGLAMLGLVGWRRNQKADAKRRVSPGARKRPTQMGRRFTFATIHT